MKNRLSIKQKKWFSLISAYLVSLGIPIATCAIVFPPEITTDAHLSVSATFVLTIIVSITAFRDKVKTIMSNYGVTVFWLICGIVSVLFANFFQELAVISWVAFGSNVASVPLFKIAENNSAKLKLLSDRKLENEIDVLSNSAKEEHK